jgi:SLA1 homology domain 1, SHD1
MRLHVAATVGIALGILVGPAGSVTLWAADQKIDVDKLKPGDKLEVEVKGAWVPAEFESAVNKFLIKIKRPGLPGGEPVRVGQVRLPGDKPAGKEAAAGPAAAAPAAATNPASRNPFETPEEKQFKTQPQRTWASFGGKFKIEATLVGYDGTNVVLRREDGKEVSVRTQDLSDADQEYVLSAVRGTSLAGANSVAAQIEITPTDVPSAKQANIDYDAPWTYQATTPAALKLSALQMVLPPVEVGEEPLHLVFYPQEKKLFAVFAHRAAFPWRTVIKIHACDLAERKVESSGVFGIEVAPMAISPNGKLVVARTEKWGIAGNSELQLYAREGNKVKPLAAWLPYRHHAGVASRSSKLDPSRPALNADGDVTLVEFLDDSHLLTMNRSAELAVWNLPKIEPAYHLPPVLIRQTFRLAPAFTLDKSHFAHVVNGGIAIVRSLDGATAGFIPADTMTVHADKLAFSDDGRKLAFYQSRRLRVYDMTKGELVREFPVPVPLVNSCAWVSDKHVLLNEKYLVDVERRIPVAVNDTYPSNRPPLYAGLLWSVKYMITKPTILNAVPAVPNNFKDPAAGQTADQLLAIKPGMEVQLELPPPAEGGADPRPAIVERLVQNGLKVVEKSNVRLVGKRFFGPGKSVSYTAKGEVAVTPKERIADPEWFTLSFIVDGEPVWTGKEPVGSPSFVLTNPGESPDEAAWKKRELRSFEQMWIPTHVARVPAEIIEAIGELREE